MFHLLMSYFLRFIKGLKPVVVEEEATSGIESSLQAAIFIFTFLDYAHGPL